jgi:hypothetical protein
MTELERPIGEDRREFLSKYGKLALVAPPVLTVLLSTSMSSPAIAQSTGGGGPKGNNGLGNGPDPQPPGNPPVNDGDGTWPGNPGNKGGNGPNIHSANFNFSGAHADNGHAHH